MVNSDITQVVELRPEGERFLRLLELLGEWYEAGKVLVFVHSQDKCDTLFRDLLKARRGAGGGGGLLTARRPRGAIRGAPRWGAGAAGRRARRRGAPSAARATPPHRHTPHPPPQAGYPCLSLHGGKDQSDRECTIADFKAGVGNILIATSVAARGLDVRDLVLVRRVWGSGCRVWGSGCRVWGLGFGVRGARPSAPAFLSRPAPTAGPALLPRGARAARAAR